MVATVHTTLGFFPRAENKGLIVGTEALYNGSWDYRPVEIEDVRGNEQLFTLDVNGFQYVTFPSAHLPFTDDSVIQQDLYPETAEFVKNLTGASRVHIAAHRVRSQSTDYKSEFSGKSGPAPMVHGDFTRTSAYDLLLEHLPEHEVHQLTKTRWAIVNVWRALEVFKKDPFAVCDSRSIRREDLVEHNVCFPTNGEGLEEILPKKMYAGTTFMYYTPWHKWYYKSDMTPEDVVCLNIFDTKDGNPGQSLHSAFRDPRTVEGHKNRKRIEIRCLVSFEDQVLE